LGPLSAASDRRGRLFGQLDALGFAREQQAEALVEEAVTTSAIEGARLSRDAVRSSVAWRLGLDQAGLVSVPRDVDGVVELLLDATTGYQRPLTAERLCGWQAALFPTGYSGLSRIVVGAWRTGPMQVVSGAMGKQRVHFEAPPADRIPAEMDGFLNWWAGESTRLSAMVRAAVAHLRFETVHPFEDGNGRVGRALIDMALAQGEREPRRFYSLSAQIHEERADYYRALEQAQRGDGEITGWIVWFLGCVARALDRSQVTMRAAVDKGRFWRRIAEHPLNDRQRKVVNRLLELGRGGFEGGLTNRKYRGLTKAPKATAIRDLADLLQRGIIVRDGSGRSTRYHLNWDLIR
jgi:Fic family protein